MQLCVRKRIRDGCLGSLCEIANLGVNSAITFEKIIIERVADGTGPWNIIVFRFRSRSVTVCYSRNRSV